MANVFPYSPSSAEVALAQGWIGANGYGSALTPWQLDTDTLAFTVPTTSGGGSVRFGFGAGVFASITAPQGSLDQSAGPAPEAPSGTPTPGLPLTQAGIGGISPLLLIGGGVLVWWFFLRKKR